VYTSHQICTAAETMQASESVAGEQKARHNHGQREAKQHTGMLQGIKKGA
jgi:hypothetical protein